MATRTTSTSARSRASAAGTRYGLRADGPYDPDQGFHFDPNKLLVDPYAKRLDRPFVRSPRLRLPREDAVDTAPLVPKAIVGTPELTLQKPKRNVRSPQLFYELNVRGYTMRHPSVQGPLRGTIAGLTTRRVIDHLKYLGVDVVAADADRGLHRRRPSAGARADQCLGLQPDDLLRASIRASRRAVRTSCGT